MKWLKALECYIETGSANKIGLIIFKNANAFSAHYSILIEHDFTASFCPDEWIIVEIGLFRNLVIRTTWFLPG